MKFCYIFLGFLFLFKSTFTFSKQGIWENVQFPQDKGYMLFTKSMYQGTVVSLKIDCTSDRYEMLTIDWLLRYTPCAQDIVTLEGLKTEPTAIDMLKKNGPYKFLFPDYFDYDTLEYINGSYVARCDGNSIFLPDKLKTKPYLEKLKTVVKRAEKESSTGDQTVDGGENEADKKTEDAKETRRRRVDPPANPTASVTRDYTTPSRSLSMKQDQIVDNPKLVRVWKSGYYAFIVRIRSMGKFNAKLTVAMKGKVGYISAVDWPRLIINGVMGLVYIIYGLVWLVLLACNWRDLMRLQYWIGGVIVLEILEKAVLYADYQNIANNGKPVTEGTVIFAVTVSSLKDALAIMLLIIVSVGFGTLKARLGSTFYKVLFVGGLYFILATVLRSMIILKQKDDLSTDLVTLSLVLILLLICCWGFSNLVQTTRQLRLRGDIVKLTLIRRFRNTLIFAVLASVILMIWLIVESKKKICLRAWQEIWLGEAFSNLPFSVILAVIMILWRPSSNSQRYAFSPLIDAADDDDEEDETVSNDAFDDLKKRNKQANGSPRQKQNSIDGDLKCQVEENISSTLSDKA